MPNQVTSHNDRTLFKAARALDAIDRLMDAGLLIREPAEKEEPKKVYRGAPSEDPTTTTAPAPDSTS